MIVLDANVIVKCFIFEKGSRAALQLLREHRKIIAPALSRIEISAAICRHVRSKNISADEGKNKCKEWENLLNTDTIELIPDHELINNAIHLAVTIKQPLQNCMYLEVMRRVDAPLITADRQFYKEVSPVYVHVQLLEGISANL